MERRTFKCRFCDFETQDYKELMAHERNCYDNYTKEEERKLNKEISEDMNMLNTKRNDYIGFADKMAKKYQGMGVLDKFVELFGVDGRCNKLIVQTPKSNVISKKRDVIDECADDDMYLKNIVDALMQSKGRRM